MYNVYLPRYTKAVLSLALIVTIRIHVGVSGVRSEDSL